MAAIQCSVSLENKTGSTMTFLKKANEHGVFMSTPPLTIPNGETGSWEHGSDGVATGSEGIVEYKDTDGRVYRCHFANPFWGSTWELHSISTNDGRFEMTGNAGGSDGGRAEFKFSARRK